MALIKRVGLGRRLTHAEVDANFQFLLDKISILEANGGGGTVAPWNGKPVQLVFKGDSITFGSNSSDPVTKSYPAQLQSLLGSVNYSVVKRGIPSETTRQMLADAPTEIDTLYNASTYSYNFAILLGGINDVNNETVSPPITEQERRDNITAWHAGRQAKGYRTIACTMLRCTHRTDLEASRVATNTWLRANWQALGCVALIDYDADTRLNPDDPAVFADKLHPTDIGYGYMAEDAKAVIDGLMASLGVPVTPNPTVNNKAYKFNGTSQTLTAANINSLGFMPGQPMTIAFRAMLSADAIANGGRFCFGRGTSSYRSWDLILERGADNYIRLAAHMQDAQGNRLALYAGYGFENTSIAPLSAGTYYDFLVDYTGGITADSLGMYVNNSKDQNAYATQMVGTFSGLDTAGNVKIGEVVTINSFNSQVDYLLFADGVMTSAERVEFYGNPNNPNFSFKNRIKAFYKFNNNLLDETGVYNLTAASPVYV